jgi:hypothetical protein
MRVIVFPSTNSNRNRPHTNEPGPLEKSHAQLKDQEQAGRAHQQRSGQHEGIIEDRRVPPANT